MDCPECAGPLDTYLLRGREASICDRCGWVGIEADHRGTGEVGESWDEALGRFYERQVETTRRRADLPPVVASADSTSGDDPPSGDPADSPTDAAGEDDEADVTGRDAAAEADEGGGDVRTGDGAVEGPDAGGTVEGSDAGDAEESVADPERDGESSA